MAQHNSTTTPAERSSWLLPTNRRLRNLLAISLRNISLGFASPVRRKDQAYDDDALPQTLTSPAKLLALQEQKALGHSRSSTDLRAVVEAAATDDERPQEATPASRSPTATSKKGKENVSQTAQASPRRPQLRRPRRRSTLEWANATPQRRQEKLQATVTGRMADAFFSLHVQGVKEPVYVSEVVEQTMNPTFRHIDWTACAPGVTRSGNVKLRVWAKGAKAGNWQQLLSVDIALDGLYYLGKNMDALHTKLPENAVIMHMIDGLYVAPTGSVAELTSSRPGSAATASSVQSRAVSTSSFDALLRLSKLDDSIQDALATRNQIADDLERLLQASKAALTNRDAVAEAEDRIKTIDYAKKTVEKQLEKARKQQEERRAALKTRRDLMASEAATRENHERTMQQVKPEFPSMRDEHEAKKNAMQNQRRRICEDLQHIYPIEQVSGKVLSFSIGGLHLPNSDHLDSEPPETVAAALGYVAHTLQLLSFYLSHPLPYPVTPRGSTSSIHDPVSILQTKNPITSEQAEDKLRTYPLFSKSMPRFRFEYAVFLLNQNIRIILDSAFSLRVLDIRQTLANLKYLLYVATAGDGELPARKAGGIRGLMRVPALERTGSADSASSGLSGLTLFSNGKARAHGGAADRLREISAKVS
ncbi:UV radiation resistance-associated protein [Cercospora beticola]|uniref:Autophagy-related protein 14 n=1 Tax=Cercospora beticola TaxID=122368 RepID=A0A2G5I3I3_CERBT|nr:UV radiation resistance-associated protein [Cercospora beticola]PIA99043.1 UV radiation resistance-associated protein [Cercospora beticola]WPA99865.1 hypothetical protein RHO25_004485 [Cercospora beticola]CAK1361967.1 unnamed protein product [Cercospora beticola]